MRARSTCSAEAYDQGLGPKPAAAHIGGNTMQQSFPAARDGEVIEEQGVVLVRSLWCAEVTLLSWEPQHETTHRRLVPPAQALDIIRFPAGARPIYQRWLQEALLHASRMQRDSSTLDEC